ncbi:MAG: phosphoribosylanthranilate isomerase [bacterium]
MAFRELLGTGIDAIQIHGVHEEAYVFDLGIRTFVATSPQDAGRFPHHEIIIDSSWGSGKVADWDLILDILDRPYILSGGLTPDNVAEALRKLQPCGIDVCSGVEASPGRKTPEKLEEFLSIVGSVSGDFRSNLGS